MRVVKAKDELKQIIVEYKKQGKRIGFVPTMGYLHEGHLSLVSKAKEIADIVVMSIFVNPIQFGPNEDFDKYPRDFARDEKLAESAGVDIIFYPSVAEMYNDSFQTYVDVEGVSKNLCGAKREGHFRGVSTVVLKLFNIVKPDAAVFGIKDAQQVRVIEKMTEDLDVDVEIVRGEIVREKDGLALSSRNKYLSETERQEALCLRQTLLFVKSIVLAGERNTQKIKEKVLDFLKNNNYSPKIDYIELVDFATMKKLEILEGDVLAAVAFYIGKTRLIDNILLKI